MQINFKIDKYGYPRAIVDESVELVSSFLEEDAQRDLSWCDKLLEIIKDVKNGNRKEWSGTGNAHTLTLTRNKATIENEFADLPPLEIDLPDIEIAVKGWRDFIKSKNQI